jgi:hypothetical protein
MDNKAICVECKSGYGRLESASTPTCSNMMEIFGTTMTETNGAITSYGYKADTNMYVPCSTAGCKNCFSDYSQCISTTAQFSCPPNHKIYVDSARNLACQPDTSSLPGYGPTYEDPSFLLRCRNDACVECIDNFEYCSSKNYQTTPIKAYYSDGRNRCFFPISAHTNGIVYGFNIEGIGGLGGFARCIDPYCQTCGEDYTKCTVCNPISVNIGGRCVIYNMIPPRFFGKTASVHSYTPVDDCTIPNCNVCQKDYFNQISCYRCKNSTTTPDSDDYYLDPPTNRCVLIKDITIGYGRDLSTGLVEMCRNCPVCSHDFSRCEGCFDTDYYGYQLYYVEPLNACFAVGSISNLVQVGINLAQKNIGKRVLSKCPDGCMYCATDSTQCSTYTVATLADCSNAVADCTKCLKGNEASTCFECASQSSTGYRQYVYAFSRSRCEPLAPPSDENSRLGLWNINSMHLLTSCADSNCEFCQEDINVCTQCILSYALENGRCYLKSPLGKGMYRLGDDPIFRDCSVEGSCPSCYYGYYFCDVLCADPNCLSCSTTDTYCTECRRADTPEQQTYLYNSKCVLVDDIPLGYGIDVVRPRKTEACLDKTLCEDCRPNSLRCVKCKKDADGIEYPTYNGQCVLTSPGRGLDINTGVIEDCITGCLRCSRNHLICTQCDNANLYYMGSDSNGVAQCQHPWKDPNFPLGMGPDLTTMTVKSCPTGCVYCFSSNLICHGCDTKKEWYLGKDCSGKKQCQHRTDTPSIPLGFGPDASDGIVESCRDPYCLSCFDSFTVCTTCNDGYYLKNVLPADPTTCYDLASIPNYYGPDLTSNPLIVDACSTPSCLICSSDKSICNKCDGAYYLDSTNNKCVADSVASNTQGYGIVTTSSINEILPCKDLRCVTCSADHTKCTICNSATILNKVDRSATQQPMLFPMGQDSSSQIHLLPAQSRSAQTHCARAVHRTICSTRDAWLETIGTLLH